MNAREALKTGWDMAEFVCMAYLADLTPDQLLFRPCPGANHIIWQLGHLISSEHQMMEGLRAGSMPPLPDGFAARYTKETAGLNDAGQFDSKEQLLEIYRTQRAATVAILESLTDADLDRETGVHYAPTIGSMMSLQGSHWMMHSGQWAIIRRQHGLPPLF